MLSYTLLSLSINAVVKYPPIGISCENKFMNLSNAYAVSFQMTARKVYFN